MINNKPLYGIVLTKSRGLQKAFSDFIFSAFLPGRYTPRLWMRRLRLSKAKNLSPGALVAVILLSGRGLWLEWHPGSEILRQS